MSFPKQSAEKFSAINFKIYQKNILKIVEKNINTVYMKMKNTEKAKEDAKNIIIDIPTHVGAKFKPKEKKKDKFSDLW